MQTPVVLKQKDNQHSDIVKGLKQLYREIIAPLEIAAQFTQFYEAPLSESDFEKNPMVLLIGQYSVGKTSFIEYILGKPYPGQNIGENPTTDRVVAVHYGDDRVIPGNTAYAQPQFSLHGLDKIGTTFLDKFNVTMTKSDFLKQVILIDTPGVLSGGNQRGYNFPKAMEWFGNHSDLILLLFDAHKLDISNELRAVIEALHGNENKIRIILNKADSCASAESLRGVNNSLLWSLSRIINTPEAVRVYYGSFWSTPLRENENKPIIEREMRELLSELAELPSFAVLRKVDDLMKRIKYLRAIAVLVCYLRNEMPIQTIIGFGIEKKKEELIRDLPRIYRQMATTYGFSEGDYDPPPVLQAKLRDMDFMKFPKDVKKLVSGITRALSTDLPNLLQPLQQAVGDFSGTGAATGLDSGGESESRGGSSTSPPPLVGMVGKALSQVRGCFFNTTAPSQTRTQTQTQTQTPSTPPASPPPPSVTTATNAPFKTLVPPAPPGPSPSPSSAPPNITPPPLLLPPTSSSNTTASSSTGPKIRLPPPGMAPAGTGST